MPDPGLYPVPDDLNLGATIRGFVPGQRLFDRYTLQRVVGRGGMGVVWLAQDEKLEQRVALKFLPEAVRLDSAALDDLKRETRRGLSLAHPHIVRIYDFVDDATAAAISMEYVDGPTLSALRIEQPSRVFEPAAESPCTRLSGPISAGSQAGNFVCAAPAPDCCDRWFWQAATSASRSLRCCWYSAAVTSRQPASDGSS